MQDLKERAVRGGLARLAGQTVSFVLRFAYIAVLARLLNPEDFGLVAMVTVVTGIYELFTSAGLLTAMIQQTTITNEQISKLFWVNILAGLLLALLCIATAPILVSFYNEPRLFWITVTTTPVFFLNAAGVQHMAILQRQLRYTTVTLIEIVSLLASIATGIGMALAGYGYWAIVWAPVVAQAVSTLSAVALTRWVPGWISSAIEIAPLLRYGGAVTAHSAVSYVAHNFDKVLIGRAWGADDLGLYGRAYQVVSIPITNLNAAVGGIVFATLSRLQDNPARLRNYFLKAYCLVVSMTIPVTIFCAMLADEIVLVALGPKWVDAAVIFRLLSPTILIFALINPLSWLLFSVGLQRRSLNIALAMAPLLVAAYLIGLPYGPNGVAATYSGAMAVWVVPHVLWSLHGTAVSPTDLLLSIGRPMLAGLVAAAASYTAGVYASDAYALPVLPKLLIEGGTMTVVYALVLLLVLGQKEFYLDLFRALRRTRTDDMSKAVI